MELNASENIELDHTDKKIINASTCTFCNNLSLVMLKEFSKISLTTVHLS